MAYYDKLSYDIGKIVSIKELSFKNLVVEPQFKETQRLLTHVAKFYKW